MESQRRCLACGQSFTPHPCVPRQQYCSAVECQKTRRRRTQKCKMAEDPDYRDNQKRYQKQWRDSHPGYWRGYRAANPEYAQRNRERQRERDARRRQQSEAIAKMYEQPRRNLPISGRFRLIPLGGVGVAKMYEQIVEIVAIKAGCG